MSATLTLTRTRFGIGIGPWIDNRAGEWQVIVDGTVAGEIAPQETVEVPVEPGHHTLRLRKSRRFLSPERSFEAADEAVARFRCRFAMLWPQGMPAEAIIAQCRAAVAEFSLPAEAEGDAPGHRTAIEGRA